jgi:cytochrome d ubiquinol oxidase subunit II
MAGADYGAGVWAMLSWGPRAKAQRELIARAIGPIWEANHVWLILVVTVFFTAFPTAFATITTMLHIPLSLMLIGIVLRGSAFVFGRHDITPESRERPWGRVFSASSLLTPVLLGVTIGAIASGNIHMKVDSFEATFIRPWLAPFPLVIGLLTLGMFALLAAVYLTLETTERALQDDFRRRALASAIVVAILAVVAILLADTGAPRIGRGIGERQWGLLAVGSTATLGLGSLLALWKRRYRLARMCAAGQVTLILWGWGLAQYPYLVPPTLTIFNAAAPQTTLRLLFMALLLGAVLIFPSLYYLFRIFKGRVVFGITSKQSRQDKD